MTDETKTCKECGALLTKETTCDCDPEVCAHCCKCKDDCDEKDKTNKDEVNNSKCNCGCK